MAMNWQKVTQAMIDKAGEYQEKADGNKNLNPGLSNYYQSRAIELRENAGFLQAGIIEQKKS